jgi:polyhydroxybutyrate depolymerase
MRLSFVIGCGLASMVAVVGVLACGDDASSPAPLSADGGTVTEDGAVVDEDGAVVVEPDASGPKPSKVNATNETVDVGGNTRAYVLTVPKSYDAARKYPLIVAMHGDGQDATSFRAFLPLDDLTGDDAIVAYTDPHPRPDNNVEQDLFTAYDQNIDQRLVEATIDAVKAKYSVDAAKIWGFGYSKGGFMLNQIACRKPGLLKAMTVHASGAPQDAQCPGVTGLPVLATEGSQDTGIGGEYDSQYWAQINGCGGQRTASTPPGCETYDGCPAGKPVTYCRAAGVSHYPIWDQAAAVSWAWLKAL